MARVRSWAACCDPAPARTPQQWRWRRPASGQQVVCSLLFSWNDAQLGAAILRQVLFDRRLDVRRRQRAIAIEILFEIIGFASRGVIRVQLVRLAPEAPDPLHAAIEVRFDL